MGERDGGGWVLRGPCARVGWGRKLELLPQTGTNAWTGPPAGGGKELEEPLVVRPTSETIVNHMFAQVGGWQGG